MSPRVLCPSNGRAGFLNRDSVCPRITRSNSLSIEQHGRIGPAETDREEAENWREQFPFGKQCELCPAPSARRGPRHPAAEGVGSRKVGNDRAALNLDHVEPPTPFLE